MHRSAGLVPCAGLGLLDRIRDAAPGGKRLSSCAGGAHSSFGNSAVVLGPPKAADPDRIRKPQTRADRAISNQRFGWLRAGTGPGVLCVYERSVPQSHLFTLGGIAAASMFLGSSS